MNNFAKMSLVFKCLNKNYPAFINRSFHASAPRQDDQFERFMFNLSGYNKYGLLKDDLYTEFSEDVQEAVRRLPEEEQMQRIYRAIRAQQAYLNHTVLPKDQWTKFEDNHKYLQPYLDEVLREKQEREDWEANH